MVNMPTVVAKVGQPFIFERDPRTCSIVSQDETAGFEWLCSVDRNTDAHKLAGNLVWGSVILG